MSLFIGSDIGLVMVLDICIFSYMSGYNFDYELHCELGYEFGYGLVYEIGYGLD